MIVNKQKWNEAVTLLKLVDGAGGQNDDKMNFDNQLTK